MKTSNLLRALAVGILSLSFSSSALAEVRPDGECKNCKLDHQIQYADGSVIIGTTCYGVANSEVVFAGTPTTGTAGTMNCENCPTVNGHECEPNPNGPSLDCTVSISKTITLEVSFDITASGGVDIGFFNDKFEVHAGISETQSTTVTCAGNYKTPYCKKAVIEGIYHQIKGKKMKITVTFTKKVDMRAPDGDTFDYTEVCDSASVTMTYDENSFDTSISAQSLNDCSYVGDGGDGGDGGDDSDG